MKVFRNNYNCSVNISWQLKIRLKGVIHSANNDPFDDSSKSNTILLYYPLVFMSSMEKLSFMNLPELAEDMDVE